MEEEQKNYYEILEVGPQSTSDDIYNAYMRAKNAYSGDSVALYSLMSKEESDNAIELIEEAYNILSDRSKRKQYNESLGVTLENNDSSTEGRIPITSTQETFSEKSDGHVPVAKIVANKRFTLKYEVKNELEKEIESASEFDGELLKKIRTYKNVDIPRMSDMTKVSKTYLINIENECLDNLPALVYVRGFVYQYAKCLKLNPDMVATSYINRIKALKEAN